MTRTPNISIVVLLKETKEIFISGLEDDLSSWVEDEGRIGDLLNGFYSSLFSSSSPTKFDAILDCVEPRVTREMNEKLLHPFVASKVQVALAQMKANTTPGLDGFPPCSTNNIGQKLEWRYLMPSLGCLIQVFSLMSSTTLSLL